MPPRTPIAALLALALAGCAAGPVDPEDLELVRFEAVEEEAALPAAYALLLRSRAPERSGLWVPLPSSDRYQEVRTLVLEVAPPGAFRLVDTEAGERVLHVPAPAEGRASVSIRVRIDRYAKARGELPRLPDGARVPDAPDPVRYLAALRRRGVEARLAHGLELTPSGVTERVAWPEVRVEREWLPLDPTRPGVGLRPGCIRLHSSLPRAELEGEPVEAETDLRLERAGE